MDNEEQQEKKFSNQYHRYRAQSLNNKKNPSVEEEGNSSYDECSEAVNLVKSEIRQCDEDDDDDYDDDDDDDSSFTENESLRRQPVNGMFSTSPGSSRNSENWHSEVDCSGINAMSIIDPRSHARPSDAYGRIFDKYTKRPNGEFGLDDNDSDPDIIMPDSSLSPYNSSGLHETLMLSRSIASSSGGSRRTRSEKKPIPDELKDDRYFERRKRNNIAAKKSRDARKSREEIVASRANYLERENAVLQAQVEALRDEAMSLKKIMFAKNMKLIRPRP